jgi:hypothetical protein
MAVLQVGCATTGVEYAQAERSLGPLSQDRARVYFYRDASMMGAAIQPLILLDGLAVGRSQPGGYFVIDVAPGDHVASSTTEVEHKVSLQLTPGSTTYVASSISFGLVVGRITLSVQNENTARSVIAGLRMTPALASSAATGSGGGSSASASATTRRGPLTMDDLSGLLPPKQR